MRFTNVCLLFVLAAVGAWFLVGCDGGTVGGASFQVVTFQDGKQVSTCEMQATEAKVLSPEFFGVANENGKLSWFVLVENKTAYRTFCTGQITAVTDPAGVIDVNFGLTVEANTPLTKVGRSAVTIDGAPIDFKVVKVNCALVPGAGCETPTTHVKGNWPAQELVATYKANFGKSKFVVVEVPAPTLGIAIDGIEMGEKGGKNFEWSLTAKNNENRAVNLRLRAIFTLDSGEKIEPRDVEMILQPNEKRTVTGFKSKAKNAFRSVEGTTNIVSKTYVK